jgi:hypothetical protein
MEEFRRCGFTENAPGPATQLTVSVKAAATTARGAMGNVET